VDGRRSALIVASDVFEDAGLGRLQAPAADAEALARVLGDPGIGGFQVRVVHNEASHVVQGHVEDLFAEGRPDDLLLLHFSGHGLKSDSGELFLAATNTRPDRLASTAVSADFVQRCMRGSRARSIVLFLDCCYGGAFGEGVAVRAAGPANVLDSFPAGKLGGGRGRAVITASSAMEYAFEGSALATTDQKQPSVFTAAVVAGLESGAADRDEDGLVSLTELYDYVFDQVRAQNPNQTPSRDIELQGELYVARSRRRRVRAVPLPADLRHAVEDANMYTRLGAVGELRARLASADPGVALGAREALEAMVRSDTSYVAEAAGAALATAPSPEDPGGYAGQPPAVTASPAATPDSDPPRAAALLGSPGPPTAAPTPTTATPTTATATPALPRHRGTAARTLLTGSALALASVLLPEFVYGSSAFSFGTGVGVGLVVVGLLGSAAAIAVLAWPGLRARWPWPVLVVAVLALAGVLALLDATSDLGASDLQLGVWVALGGGLTAVAAGVVAVVGLARRGPEPPTHAGRPAPPLQRTVGLATVVAAGLVLASSFAVRFVQDTQALVQATFVWSWWFPALVALAGGILALRLHRWPWLGPALTVGAGASSVWGLWDLPRIWNGLGTSSLDGGYFLELIGLSGLVACGAGALALLVRDHGVGRGRARWGLTGPALAVGVLSAIPFALVARTNAASGETGNLVHDLQVALFAALVPVLSTLVRPWGVGRSILLGWALGATGTVVTYWRLLREAGTSLSGIPYVLLALAALAVVALAVPEREAPSR